MSHRLLLEELQHALPFKGGSALRRGGIRVLHEPVKKKMVSERSDRRARAQTAVLPSGTHLRAAHTPLLRRDSI